ncbi:MAG: hypothetical protein EAX96_15065 [Candidatus Lokiarchaeota archaeon]|nr:hypothetical protein [Candidatus Lokiarchaeota archaeon]
MSQKEKEQKKAFEAYENAQKMVAKEKFDKALKEFKKAYEKFTKIGALQQAEKVALRLVENSLIEKRYNVASDALIEVANIALLQDKTSSALQHYKSAINFLVEDPKINKPKLSAEIACLASFILIIKGKFQDGIEFFKKHMEINKFEGISEIELISFSESLFNTLISKKDNFFKNTLVLSKKLNLRDGEKKLVNKCIQLSEIYLKSKLKFTINKEVLAVGEEIDLKIVPISTGPIQILQTITKYDTSRFELINEPKNTEEEVLFRFKTRLGGKGIIGPLTFQVKTEDGFEFPLIFKKEIEIKPGKGQILVKFPQIFEIIQAEKQDIEFVIINEGKGEANDISLEVQFPEQILLVGGSKLKKIHSLPKNANFSLKFLIQALLQGEFEGHYKLNYNDGEKVLENVGKFLIKVI